jgi:hypothetical protein
MDIDIDKALADFELKLKNTTATEKPAPKQAKKVAPAPSPEPAPIAPSDDAPCVTKLFKDMIKVFPEGFIGNKTAKDFLVELLETQLPECPVKAG